MKISGLIFLAAALPLWAQDPATVASIDDAFQLTGVRSLLEALPSRVNQITTSAVAQFPKDLRQQFEPYIKDVSRKFLEHDAFQRQLRTYFVKHYDSGKMATFLALERTPTYRTMHRVESAAGTAASDAGQRRFEANLKSDPAEPQRVAILQRLDEATNSTDLQVRLASAIIQAMADSLGAQMPADMETKSAAFATKVRPVIASQVLMGNLYVYRNADNADLDDYVSNAQQSSVAWFNHNLQSAILAVSAERIAKAGEDIKTKATPPVK
jgi:hypothetical protein